MNTQESAEKMRKFYKEHELKGKPITGHPLFPHEMHIKENYIVSLLILAGLDEPMNESQQKFITRLISGADESFLITELLNKAYQLPAGYAEDLIEDVKSNDLGYNLLVDMLLTLALASRKSDEQTELVSETALALGIPLDRALVLAKIAGAILEQDPRKIFELSENRNNLLDYFICYIKEFHKGVVSQNDKLIYLYGDKEERTPFQSLIKDRGALSRTEELFQSSIHFNLEKGVEGVIKDTINLSADKVIIENYYLENEDIQILVENCKQVEFINCSFIRINITPLSIKKCRQVLIKNCAFRDISGRVMMLSGIGSFELINSVVSNVGSHRVLDIEDVTNLSLSANTFNKVHFRQLSEGILTMAVWPMSTVIEKNVFVNCANQSGFGPLLIFGEKIPEGITLSIDGNSFENCFGGSVAAAEGLEPYHYKNNSIDNGLKFLK